MSDRSNTNILLVDDQPAKLLSLETILAPLDVNVLKSSSADEALKLLLEHDVAVVLVDVCMPQMDGFELAELIRQHPRFYRTAIIFISAVHLSDEDRLRGYHLGAVDYIPVPIVPEVLRAKVSVFADLHRKTEELYRLNEQLEHHVAQRTADLKATASSLTRSEERYRRLIHALPAAVYTCDPDGRLTLFNQAAADLWGQAPDLEHARWCGSFRAWRADGTPLTAEDNPIATALTRGHACSSIELIIERPDGTRRSVVAHPELLHDERGNLIGAINMMVDVTDKRKAEQAQALLAEIVASSEDAIISTALDGAITSWNAGAEQIFGYTAPEVLGKSVTLLIPPDRAREESEIIDLLRSGERVRSFETIRIAKDGRTVHVSLAVSPVRDQNGEIIGVSKAARDIGERKLAEAVLSRDREMLERLVADRTRELEVVAKRLSIADRMATIGTLAAGLGHDMANLLLPIRMSLDAIEAGSMTADLREDVLAIRKASEYLQRLAASLRLLALDPENESELGGSTQLTQWWYEAEGMIRNGIPRTVALKFDAPESLAPISIGKAALTQIMFNLVQNAGDALRSRQDGRVCITGRQGARDGQIVITVTDNGPGMSEETRSRCLEPFFTTKTRGMSTGLGLALVGGLIKKAGGTIEIDSRPGEGARFTLTLRCVQPVIADAASSRPGQSRAVVTLGDPRLLAHVRSVLQSLKFDTSGEGLDHADLWVTDTVGDGEIAAVNRFVRSGPPRRAVVFTSERLVTGADSRVSIVETPIVPSVLRSRLHQLLVTQCAEGA